MAVADFYGILVEGVTLQVDTITITSASPTALTKTGIVSFPSTEVQGASPTSDIIVVFDTTTSHLLALNTDYTLIASGAGPTLTYSVQRISTSALSANGNTCTVTYKWGDIPDFAGPMGYAGTSPTGTAATAAVKDTEGTGVSGLGSAMPGGSLTDPAMGKQSSSETGAPGSEYTAKPVAPSQYGWPSGVPDTESVYGGGLPSAFTPQTAYIVNGSVPDTTIGGGSALISGLGTPPAYRAPTSGVAGTLKDTSLTDILGNQSLAQPLLQNSAYAAVNQNTLYEGATSQPSALKSQTDTFLATLTTEPYYLTQQGLVPSSIVVTDTTASATLVLNTSYTVTTIGNGPATTSYITLIVAGSYAVGHNISVAYSYGDATYWDSNVPASPPGVPGLGASTVQTDNIATFNATPFAVSKTGITTPPGSVVVKDTANGKTQVLNLDYTITVSGSGSTLTYSITRLGGSPNSTINDAATVTYSYGNPAYFTSGPVVPVNRGVLVPFTPPAGLTEIDYYLIQASDLGTKYVPASGQAMYSGQPAGAGAEVGEPTFQSDTFTSFPNAAIAAPAAPTVTGSGSGSTVTNGLYKVVVTYVNVFGETVGSAVGSATTTGTQNLVITSPSAATGATGWYAYVTLVGGNTFTRQQAAGSPTAIGTNLTLTANPTSTGANPPAYNATLPTLSKAGVVTAPQAIVVRDTTSTEFDPMQPTGTVLEYGYDYTVLTVNSGDAVFYQIQRLSGSVNSAATDTIVADYMYDAMGTNNLTYGSDSITLVAGAANLLHTGVVTPASSLIVFDTTSTKALAFGLDYTVTQVGTGPVTTYTITRISGGPASVGATDTLSVYYAYGVVLGAVFNQGLVENTPIIYRPDGSIYSFQGYNFMVAAGNRIGLSSFSNASDYAVPLNYNAQQPGHMGQTQTELGLDPANTINPIYNPAGAVHAGTGLGG